MVDDQQLYPRFKDKRTARFAAGEFVREFQSFSAQADKRLRILESAPNQKSLIVNKASHFEALVGDRKGQFSIRINLQ